VTDLVVRDVKDTDAEIDPDVLYYTVQVMALYNPVDPDYFEYADISLCSITGMTGSTAIPPALLT
jgi:hypothetical protein